MLPECSSKHKVVEWYCHVLPGQRDSISWTLVWHFVSLDLSLGWATYNYTLYKCITHKPVTCLLVLNFSCPCNCLCSKPFCTVGPAELPVLDCPNQVKVKVTLRLTVSQSVILRVEPHLRLMTRYLLLFDSYGLVFFFGRPLWREDGTVFCICCWLSPA
jgi:hypothetical protein